MDYSNTDLFFKHMGSYPLLAPEEERQLARAVAAGRRAARRLAAGKAATAEEAERLARIAARGQQARQRMIEANIRLVISVAKRYLGYGVPLLDLVQEGNLGLIKAVDRFRPELGYKFSSYAIWWVRQAVRRAVLRHKTLIRLPVNASERLLKLPAVENELWQQLRREPTCEEVARALGMSAQSGPLYLRAVAAAYSLDAPRYPEDGEEAKLRWEYMFEDERPGPAEHAEQAVLRETMQALLETLHPREELVLRLRYGLLDGHERDRNEIAARMGLTPERVRQIEIEALERLRHLSRSRRLRDYLG